MSLLLQLVEGLSALGMLFGIALALSMAVRQKALLKAVFIVVVPFYIVAYILRQPESQQKKVAGILVMGCFITYVFASLFLLLLKPPVPL